jgi:hypothetical protein
VTKRTAVIGAGLAGLACARVMRRAGCYVEVFEADRIIGGRMATTRAGQASFDHGAQYVTARSTQFQTYLSEMLGTGYAARWKPKTSSSDRNGGQMLPWYVGTPGMSALVRPLAEGVRIQTGKRVHTIQRQEKGWYVWFDDETHVGPFAAVAVTAPAPQSALLLGPVEELANQLSRVRMTPCWTLMARLDEPRFPDQDVFSDMSEVIRWVSRNSAKPGRNGRGECIVVHASPRWSRETEEVEADDVAQELWGELSHALGMRPETPAFMQAHLWRHSFAEQQLGESFLFSSDHKVGVAGDWCLGRLAEHAFESGSGLGRAIVAAID